MIKNILIKLTTFAFIMLTSNALANYNCACLNLGGCGNGALGGTYKQLQSNITNTSSYFNTKAANTDLQNKGAAWQKYGSGWCCILTSKLTLVSTDSKYNNNKTLILTVSAKTKFKNTCSQYIVAGAPGF